MAPLVFASGAGAASRHSLGTSVFYGMLGATVMGVFFVPFFYFVIHSLVERRGTASVPAFVPAQRD